MGKSLENMGKLCRLKSLEEVQEEAKFRGYLFLSAKYAGAHFKYEYECTICHKKIYGIHNDFLDSKPCSHKEKRDPYRDATNYGYTLLDQYTKIVGVKYRYQCLTCGYIKASDHHSFLKIKSCSNCRSLFFSSKREQLIKDKKRAFAEKNNIIEKINNRRDTMKYQILAEYNNIATVSCYRSHQFEIDLTKPLFSQTCKLCKDHNRKKTREEIEGILGEYHYSLVGAYYDTNTEIYIQCPNHHVYRTYINEFRRGYRCKECQKRTTSDVVIEAQTYGFKLMSEYLGYHKDITLRCLDCGELFSTTYDNLKKGAVCKFCHSSDLEKKVTTLLQEIGFDFYKHDRKILKMFKGFKELDFVIPSKNLAIETCGSYYHSSLRKNRYYHLNKMLATRQSGYDLVTLFDYDFFNDGWKTKLEKVLNGEIVLPGTPYGYNFAWITMATEKHYSLNSSLLVPPKLVIAHKKQIYYTKEHSAHSVWDCGHIPYPM